MARDVEWVVHGYIIEWTSTSKCEVLLWSNIRTGQTNPRGIPQAKFIRSVDDVLNTKTCTDEDVKKVLQELQMRLQQYRYMEESKKSTMAQLHVKIPDITKSLDMVKLIKQQKGEEEFLETKYELNETLYTSAKVNLTQLDSVYLWLGAEVMLEYPLDEAIDLLNDRLEKAEKSKEATDQDLEFLRENITTMEVNTARVYNWDVQRRKGEKLTKSAQELSI